MDEWKSDEVWRMEEELARLLVRLYDFGPVGIWAVERAMRRSKDALAVTEREHSKAPAA